MRRKRWLLVAVTSVALLALAAPAAAVPADGNGNHLVVPIDDEGVPLCDGVLFDVSGWLKISFGIGNREVEKVVAHLDYVFYNGAGETFTWRETGPSKFYFTADGGGVLTFSGRIGDELVDPDRSLIGHVVITFDPGFGSYTEVVHGKVGDTSFAQACTALG